MTSCNGKGFGKDDHTFSVYIGGDSGKTVTIMYLAREKNAAARDPDVEISREVTIPYRGYAGTRCWSGEPCESIYIKVSTDGSTEARLILGNPLLRNGSCYAFDVIERSVPPAWEASDEECPYCKNCRYTRTWPIDSLYANLEEIKYPCYKAIRKGESYGEVSEANLEGWKGLYVY